MQHLMHLNLYLLLVMIEVMAFFIYALLVSKGKSVLICQVEHLMCIARLTVVVASSRKGLSLRAPRVV